MKSFISDFCIPTGMRDTTGTSTTTLDFKVMVEKEDEVISIVGPSSEFGIRSLHADLDRTLYFITCNGPEDYKNLERQSVRLARELAEEPGVMEGIFNLIPGLSLRKDMQHEFDQITETMRARHDADNPKYWHIFTGNYNQVMKHTKVTRIENGRMPLERTMHFQLDGHPGFLYHPGHYLGRNRISPTFSHRGRVKYLCNRIVLRKHI